MWLFTPSGFLSIVADQQRPGHALVRARVREDLEAFCARTNAPAPTETPQRDYRFRECPVRDAPGGARRPGCGDRLTNFNSEVAGRQGHDRAHRYGRIWSGMHELQQDRATLTRFR